MSKPIAETLTVVRSYTDPIQAWADIVALCRESHPNVSWQALPNPNIERDVAATTIWLESYLESLPDVRGIYLGLDTLNMCKGSGTNIEIGGSFECDPASDKIEWVFARNLRYGPKHLIYGLQELHEVYSSDAWNSVFSLCDYIFFLGYSGIVLAQSFKRIHTSRTLLPAWGFHDGDLFALGRKDGGQFTRICK